MFVQERWFTSGGISPQALKTFKALPIYSGAVVAAGSGPTETAAPPSAVFVDLLEERYLAPEGTDAHLLAPAFLRHTSPGENKVLVARLGVTQLSSHDFFIRQVLPR